MAHPRKEQLEHLFRFGKLHRKRDIRINLDDFWMAYHILIWRLMFPKDPIKPGETIHHIDGNPYNNSPFNLQKLTEQRHRSLHHPGCNIRNILHHVEVDRRQKTMSEGLFCFIRRATPEMDKFRPMRWGRCAQIKKSKQSVLKLPQDQTLAPSTSCVAGSYT